MKGGKVKMIGLKNAKNMQQMFNDIFGVSAQNIHIYLDKIVKLYNQHKVIVGHLNKLNVSMLKFEGAFLKLNPKDVSMMTEAKQIKAQLKQELNEKKAGTPIDQVTIAMYSTLKDTYNKEEIKGLSEYMNGRIPNTHTNKVIRQCGELAAIFKDIEDHKVQKDTDAICNYYTQRALANEGLMTIDAAKLDDCIKKLASIEDDGNRRNAFACLHIYMQVLFRDNTKLFDIMRIPEFDIGELKNVIKQAITEFKKTLPGCNLAFKKLLQSLDTFSDNFSNYFEEFSINDRQPLVLINSFIEDIQSQYASADNAQCRQLLREFKQIQLAFAQRLGSKLNENPVIKGLYEQLCQQIKTAEHYMDDEQPTQ